MAGWSMTGMANVNTSNDRSNGRSNDDQASEMQFSLMSLFAVATCICLAFGVWPFWEFFGPMAFVYTWAALQVAVVSMFGYVLLSGGRPSKAETTAAVFSLMPLFTLTTFVYVFVIGGSSNVAQLAGGSGLDLWSFWFDYFSFNIFGNLLAIVVLLICVSCARNVWLSRLITTGAFLSAVAAFCALAKHIPDA